MSLINTTSGHETQLFINYPPNLLDFASFCCVLFIVLGVPGNLITIIALLKCKKVHNATGVFIINLTVSDLMLGLFNLPLAASMFGHRAWVHTRFLCLLFPILRYGLLAVSVFTVLAITINRYIMIAHQKLYQRLYTKTSIAIMVVATWLGSFGALVPTLLEFWGTFGLDSSIGSCTILPDADGNSPKAFLFIFAFVLPCLAICVCYARIFCIVHQAYRKSHTSSRGSGNSNSNRNSYIIPSQCCEPLSPFQMMQNFNPHTNVQLSTTKFPLTTDITVPSEKNKTENCEIKAEIAKLEPPNPLRYSDQVRHSLSKDISTEVTSFMKPEGKVLFQIPSHESATTAATEASCPIAVALPPNEDIPQITQDFVPQTTVERCPSTKSSKGSNFSYLRGTRCRTRTGSMIARQQTLSAQDRRLLKMILVIFLSFVACYLPITVVKIFGKDDNPILNILGLLLIYMTTCINPIIYVAMSSEYRQAYVSLLTCKHDTDHSNRSFT